MVRIPRGSNCTRKWSTYTWHITSSARYTALRTAQLEGSSYRQAYPVISKASLFRALPIQLHFATARYLFCLTCISADLRDCPKDKSSRDRDLHVGQNAPADEIVLHHLVFLISPNHASASPNGPQLSSNQHFNNATVLSPSNQHEPSEARSLEWGWPSKLGMNGRVQGCRLQTLGRDVQEH
jgi:hypothetical protein